MILLLDISMPFQGRPGYAVAPFGGVKIRRGWWLWFAITYCPLDQFAYEQLIASGKTGGRLP